MTATIDPPQLSEGQPRNESLRLLPISVNLLPDEVVAARIGRTTSRVTVAVLAIVVVAMGAWYFHARQQTSAASDDLARARDESAAVTRSQHGFGDLNATKAKIADKQGKLKQLTAPDVAWDKLFVEIAAVTPPHMVLTGLAGSTTAAPQTGAGATASQSSSSPGSIMITGQVGSKATVSDFALRLLKLPGIASANVTSVAAGDKNVYTFTIQTILDKSAHSSRFATGGTK